METWRRRSERRRKPNRHIFDEEFIRTDACLDTFMESKGFTKSDKTSADEGAALKYKCEVEKCPVEATVHTTPTEDSYSIGGSGDSSQSRVVWNNSIPHYHQSEKNTSLISAMDGKDFSSAVINLHLDGVKQLSHIQSILTGQGFESVTLERIASVLHKQPKGHGLMSHMNVDDLRGWCESSKSRVPLPGSDDETFVTDFEIYDSNKNEEVGDQVNKIRIFFTTRRLLKLATHSHVLQTDSTKYMKWQGHHHLIYFGVSDAKKSFHPIGLALTTHLCQDDFVYFFKSIRDTVSTLFNHTLQPKFLLADTSDIITKAFNSVFYPPLSIQPTQSSSLENESRRIYCFHHVLNVVEDELVKFSCKRFKSEIKTDVSNIHLACDSKMFESVSKQFESKWRTFIVEEGGEEDDKNSGLANFLDYFRMEWVQKYSNWYVGFSGRLPSSNVQLHAFHNHVRNQFKIREGLDVESFIKSVTIDTLGVVSKLRSSVEPSNTTFSHVLNVSDPDWLSGYKWAQSDLLSIRAATNEYYVQSQTYTIHLSLQHFNSEVVHYINLTNGVVPFQNFESFVMKRTTIWHLSLNENWLTEGSCSCKTFPKHNLCEHMIGMAIRLKLVVPPRSVTLIANRKRKGVPLPKFKKAIIQQD